MKYHPRIIPLLSLHGDRLVKTTAFKAPSYVGDPINTIKVFNDKYCDELILLDIRTSREGTSIQFDLIEECASQCMMPLCYGGGISSIEEARILFSLGIEKIVLQSSVCRKPGLVSELSEVFGSQSICVSLDIRRSRLSGYRVLNKVAGFKKSMWLEAAIAYQELGAGEILINYVDHDGTQMGLNHELIKYASSSLSVPLIAAGGSSSLSDMQQGLRNGASAIAAGSLFVHFGPHKAVLISYPSEDQLTSFIL